MFWVAFFMCLFMVYALSSWLAKLMAGAGYSLGSALTFVLVLNAGAMAGAIGGGWPADKLHIKWVLVGMYVLAALSISLLGQPLPTAVLFVVVALAGAAMFGLFLVLARRWSRPYRLDGTLVTIANLVARGPCLLAVAAVVDSRPMIPTSVDPAAVIALLSIVFGASSTASLLVLASVRRVPAGRTSAALLLTPISSALIAALFVGERLPPSGLLGAAMILAGIAAASGVLRPRPTLA